MHHVLVVGRAHLQVSLRDRSLHRLLGQHLKMLLWCAAKLRWMANQLCPLMLYVIPPTSPREFANSGLALVSKATPSSCSTCPQARSLYSVHT